jgi:hypothetical protein
MLNELKLITFNEPSSGAEGAHKTLVSDLRASPRVLITL